MNAREIEAVGAICVMAALADGTMSDREREHVRASFEGVGEGASGGGGDAAEAVAETT